MTTEAAASRSGTGLGPAVRAAREARGLSLRELARRLDVSPSFVSQVEHGKANPSVGTLYALVTVLGTTLDDLIGDEPSRQPRSDSPLPSPGGWLRSPGGPAVRRSPGVRGDQRGG